LVDSDEDGFFRNAFVIALAVAIIVALTVAIAIDTTIAILLYIDVLMFFWEECGGIFGSDFRIAIHVFCICFFRLIACFF